MTSTFRVEELATATGLAVDTIRYYQSRGLLDPPTREGRTAVYNETHKERVDTILHLAESGFTLQQIKQVVDGTQDEILGALSGTGRTLTLHELADAAEVDPQVVTLAVAAGLLSPARSPNEGADEEVRFARDAVRLVRTARDLIDSGIPLSDLVDLAAKHASNVEAVADQAIDLFSQHVGSRESEDLSATYRRLMAQTTKLVAEHFHKTLVERGRLHIDADVDPGLAAALLDENAQLVVTCEWTH
ncbi:MAG: MerR family transcriptional regulator [Acidimicrobiia bacterium]|nr:MerR family transcriptional regulator [Acidimicrobiia bacterium]